MTSAGECLYARILYSKIKYWLGQKLVTSTDGTPICKYLPLYNLILCSSVRSFVVSLCINGVTAL